jgi:D-amino-acid dehydrogenase
MRLAVVGAGIIGVCTAYELAADGHEVVVFERAAGVAGGTSFANAGVIAPGYVTPWAAPGMPAKVLRHLWGRYAPVRLASVRGTLRQLPWLLRWWRACRPEVHAANRTRMHRLARYSRDRLDTLTDDLGLDYERSTGYMVLLRTDADLALARNGIKLLSELGVPFTLLDAARARQIEPGLSEETALRAAIHLPDDGVGNCRQFAHLLRQEAQRLGATFRFNDPVRALRPGTTAELDAVSGSHGFDGVVVCAGPQAARLLRPIGLKLPIAPVWGYSLTAPLRHVDGHGLLGPRSALMDERFKVAISRLGQRVRVAGSAEIGGRAGDFHPNAMATLYRVLHDWFPGATQLAQAQRWKGARPMLPDGPPVIGAGGRPGLWLNLGHGSSGWALAAGSARLLADQIAGREPAVDPDGLGIERLGAMR